MKHSSSAQLLCLSYMRRHQVCIFRYCCLFLYVLHSVVLVQSSFRHRKKIELVQTKTKQNHFAQKLEWNYFNLMVVCLLHLGVHEINFLYFRLSAVPSTRLRSLSPMWSICVYLGRYQVHVNSVCWIYDLRACAFFGVNTGTCKQYLLKSWSKSICIYWGKYRNM